MSVTLQYTLHIRVVNYSTEYLNLLFLPAAVYILKVGDGFSCKNPTEKIRPYKKVYEKGYSDTTLVRKKSEYCITSLIYQPVGAPTCYQLALNTKKHSGAQQGDA